MKVLGLTLKGAVVNRQPVTDSAVGGNLNPKSRSTTEGGLRVVTQTDRAYKTLRLRHEQPVGAGQQC